MCVNITPVTLVSKTKSLVYQKLQLFYFFADMHGERNVLSKYVFPELRKRACKLNKNVVECDFTWGLPNTKKKNTLVTLCLSEIKKCNFFVGKHYCLRILMFKTPKTYSVAGIVGDRYGWVPKQEDIPSQAHSPTDILNKSITEREIDLVC